MNTPNCNCYDEKNNTLKSRYRLQLHKESSRLSMVSLTPVSLVGLPIQTEEGRKPKRGQGDFLPFDFCPWCGKKYMAVVKV